MSTATNWTAEAAKIFVGKKVKNVRYMLPDEAEAIGFMSQPLVIEFSDGTYLFPQADDEGNDAGALAWGNYTDEKKQGLFPVMRE